LTFASESGTCLMHAMIFKVTSLSIYDFRFWIYD
jgi:hypothetical protein